MTTSRNDITGDKIISKNNNRLYESNYDLIFKKKEKKAEMNEALKKEEEENVQNTK